MLILIIKGHKHIDIINLTHLPNIEIQAVNMTNK